MLHDSTTRRSYYALYGEEKHTHPVDLKARIYIDSLQQIEVDTILFYRDWIGMNGYSGYGKLLWISKGVTNQYQINYDYHYRLNENIFIEYSKNIKSEAFSFYIENKIDNITSRPKQSIIQMSHDADHFIYSYINKTKNIFHVRGLEQVYDSSHIKSQLISKLQIPWSLYFNTIEQRRDSLLPDYDLTCNGLNSKILSDSSATFTVILGNFSKDTLHYYSMSCSWQDIYMTSDPKLEIEVNPCGKNFPKIKSIPPNENETVSLHINGTDIADREFKIGIKLIKAPEKNLTNFSDELKNAEIIWTRLID